MVSTRWTRGPTSTRSASLPARRRHDQRRWKMLDSRAVILSSEFNCWWHSLSRRTWNEHPHTNPFRVQPSWGPVLPLHATRQHFFGESRVCGATCRQCACLRCQQWGGIVWCESKKSPPLPLPCSLSMIPLLPLSLFLSVPVPMAFPLPSGHACLGAFLREACIGPL